MTSRPGRGGRAYLAGGGIASLAAAVFLVRDAGLDGPRVRILEELPVAGGALDGSGDPEGGYVTRGARMFEEEAFSCLWNLLDGIPSLTAPAKTVREEIREFNARSVTSSSARLVGRDQEVLDAAELGLSLRDRVDGARLLALPERVIGARRIDDFFSGHFFSTRLWVMWRTMFGLQAWSSAIEFRRQILRFAHQLPAIHTLAGARHTEYNQYDSIVRPVCAWLAQRGVVIEYGVRVTDLDISSRDGSRRVTRIRYERDGSPGAYDLGPEDLAFVTLGSITADAAYGDDNHAPELIRDKRDGAFRLWEAIAAKAPDFGRPHVFARNVDQTKWASFTLTMPSPLLLQHIERLSGNAPGTGGLMTFPDSGWLLSIAVPAQPHFPGQPDGVGTLWGYGLLTDQPGDYVPRKMSAATGQDILAELAGQLGCGADLDEIARTTTVIPVMMPYIVSQFQPRQAGDRPRTVPRGAANFAFLGQFTEVPRDVVFTVEYSVRGAMHAVYTLLGVPNEIPGIYRGLADPKAAFQTLKAALR
jgi:oleate hydratase